MIPYINVLKWNAGKTALEPFAVVEPAECWLELSYYTTGECEVYAPATASTLIALQKGHFVQIPHKAYIWQIVSVQYEFNADGARMISARGQEAKRAAGLRIIRDPMALPQNMQAALNALYSRNLGADAIAQRKIGGLVYDFSALAEKQTTAQATRENLLDFTQALLKTCGCGLLGTLDATGKIKIAAIEGADRSGTVIFAQSFDNLISATYYTSGANSKTNAQIVSTFSENDQATDYIAYEPAEAGGASGIDRAEITVNSNLSTKVKNADGTETDLDPSGATYINMQKAEGAAVLGEHQTVTEFNGEIDIAHAGFTFGTDFNLGDLVAIRDEYFGISATARVTKYTFRQDAGGYGEQAEYGNE